MNFLSETPVEEYLHSRQALFEWLFVLHNKVNDKIGDKQETDLESVVDKYERFRAKCHHQKSTGCTEPAKHNPKMRCRLVVEPVDGRTTRRLLFIVVAAVVFLMIYMA
ncbi:unnamed protein product [Ectocarpus sp. 8 AP-2014]